MFKATQEQVYANALVSEGKSVLIEAGAGAAKSTSLRYFAQQNPTKRFLVLCFNKANAVESNAHSDKTDNIYYSTVHSIAYQVIVAGDKLMRKKLQNYLNYQDINTDKLIQLGLTSSAKSEKEEKEILVKLRAEIQDCITWYCRSDSKTLAEFAKSLYTKRLSGNYLVDAGDSIVLKEELVLSSEQITKLSQFTANYWQAIIDPASDASITHDVYLKLYHLRGYNLTEYEGISMHVLCLDEAQDSNAVTLAIFKNSTIGQKVIIGDSMQQLYAWRGAGDAMTQFRSFNIAYLTESFRFGENIAELANIVLSNAGSSMELIGSGTRNEIETTAILCRTNSKLLEVIWDAAVQSKYVYSSADLKETFSKMYHLNSLSFDTVPKYPNKSLKHLKTKKQLEEASAICPEISRLLKLSNTIASYGGGLSNGIKFLQKYLVTDQREAQLIISTIHKSKGLEWDKVIIADDFLPEVDDREEQIADMWTDPVKTSLLYVAVTRAKVEVVLPEYLQDEFN